MSSWTVFLKRTLALVHHYLLEGSRWGLSLDFVTSERCGAIFRNEQLQTRCWKINCINFRTDFNLKVGVGHSLSALSSWSKFVVCSSSAIRSLGLTLVFSTLDSLPVVMTKLWLLSSGKPFLRLSPAILALSSEPPPLSLKPDPELGFL